LTKKETKRKRALTKRTLVHPRDKKAILDLLKEASKSQPHRVQ
jgi:ribosomal protein L35